MAKNVEGHDILLPSVLKYEATKLADLLQRLPIPNQVQENIAMDFTKMLPESRRNTTISVVVVRLTKYAHFIALRHPYTAKQEVMLT